MDRAYLVTGLKNGVRLIKVILICPVLKLLIHDRPPYYRFGLRRRDIGFRDECEILSSQGRVNVLKQTPVRTRFDRFPGHHWWGYIRQQAFSFLHSETVGLTAHACSVRFPVGSDITSRAIHSNRDSN